MLSINTNLSSLIAQSSLKNSTNILNQAVERMTTGYKINHAKDNAANYSIATNMTTKIGAYMVAEDNAAMGLDMLATANGSLDQISDKLTRLRDLAIQASNGTYGAQSLNAINAEANALVDEINQLYTTAEYNGMKLFGGEEATPTTPIATFAMTRSATTENSSIADLITYTDEEVEVMTTMTQAVAESSLTSGGTYSISTVDELVALADYVNAGNDTTGMTFVLGADIDLSSISNWTPIGDNYASTRVIFKGTFDGNGHVITGLTITYGAPVGLFGMIQGAVITNLGLEDISITGGYASNRYGSYVGGLVGRAVNSSICNCYVKNGTIKGAGDYLGGLVGQIYNGNSSITNCYTDVEVETNGSCDYVGGLAGSANATIVNCYSLGNVIGDYYVGGLLGMAYSCEVTNSFATGDVTTQTNIVGGLIGNVRSDLVVNVQNCYALGNVTGGTDNGGLIGIPNAANVSNSASVLADSYATQMSVEQIKSTYTGENMGFTLNNGWVVVNDTPMLTWQKEASDFLPNQGGGSSNTTGPAYAPDSIMLQIGTSSNWASQIGFSTKISLDEIEEFRNIGVDTTTDYLSMLDERLLEISEKQTELGAVSNRLESVLDEISTQYDNLMSSRSTIRDADLAEESATYIQQQILQEAAATLMSTANQSPAIALQLI